MSLTIEKNTVVSLQYELFDEAGMLIEKTDTPITYLHGGYDGIFPRVEAELNGKQSGHACVIPLKPEEAFGDHDKELIRSEPRNLFPKNVAVGMQFQGTAQGSDHIAVYTVTEVGTESVVVDANHPLAGKTVKFSCTVTEVRKATPEEVTHGHVHGAGGHHH